MNTSILLILCKNAKTRTTDSICQFVAIIFVYLIILRIMSVHMGARHTIAHSFITTALLRFSFLQREARFLFFAICHVFWEKCRKPCKTAQTEQIVLVF